MIYILHWNLMHKSIGFAWNVGPYKLIRCHGRSTTLCFFLFLVAITMFFVIIHNTYLHHIDFLYKNIFNILCILLTYIDMWLYMCWYDVFCPSYIWYICIHSCLILWFMSPSLVWPFDLVSSKVPQTPVWPPVRSFLESPHLLSTCKKQHSFGVMIDIFRCHN